MVAQATGSQGSAGGNNGFWSKMAQVVVVVASAVGGKHK
jgi:hypothetical protein